MSKLRESFFSQDFIELIDDFLPVFNHGMIKNADYFFRNEFRCPDAIA
ncbi:hypothetical protein M595_0336 [Lyngbya aestuarii BL J]|uniref:Uncharacterized protein n=1 Tax=Lyngbya aestuarii BL J TaxID=1348334 RepID=U7QQM0_9CYAN|nr:hypothetical protein M595_0336 [Lyngbya aestuarii BL J]